MIKSIKFPSIQSLTVQLFSKLGHRENKFSEKFESLRLGEPVINNDPLSKWGDIL